jgi:hypothetical protein
MIGVKYIFIDKGAKLTFDRQIKKTGTTGPNAFQKAAVNQLFTWKDQTFNQEGARSGEKKWKSLSASTAKRKITQTKERGYRNILHPTGTFQKSFTILKLTNNEIYFGSKLKVNGYSLVNIHQNGEGRNPERKILFFTKQDEVYMRKIYARFCL